MKQTWRSTTMQQLAATFAIVGMVGCSKAPPDPRTVDSQQDTSASNSMAPNDYKETQENAERGATVNHSDVTLTDDKAAPSKPLTEKSSSATNHDSEDLPGRQTPADSIGGNGATGGQRGQRSSAAPGGVTSFSSDGDPGYKPPSDPRAAHNAAEQALAAAEKSARAGDYGIAYRKALVGWQQANTYAKQDDRCAEIAQALLEKLELYGEKANQAAGVSNGTPPKYKTLLLK